MTTIEAAQYRQAANVIQSVLTLGPSRPTVLLQEARRKGGGSMELLQTAFQIMLRRGEVHLDSDLLAALPVASVELRD